MATARRAAATSSRDRKSTRLNSSHLRMSYAVFCLKKKGVDKLRIAAGSILPRVTTGTTRAPCVVSGERAAEILKATHIFFLKDPAPPEIYTFPLHAVLPS